MKQAETQLRHFIVITLFFGVLACSITDTSFFFYYKNTGTLPYPVPLYIFFKLFLPFVVNILSALIALFIDIFTPFGRTTKNLVCCFALCTICGSISIFHGFFAPLWLLPSIGVMFCSLFHDKIMLFALQLYDYLLIIVTYFYVSSENTASQTTPVFYVQVLIIVMIISTLTFIISIAMEKYNYNLVAATRDSYEKQLLYRRRYQIDSLTQVYSRQYLDITVPQILEEASKSNPVSIVILDIDFFKHVNDTYGHAAGDKVLSSLGGLCQEYMQAPCFASRFGGEEFVVVMSGYTRKKAETAIETFRSNFASLKYDFTNEHFTVSAGMTTITAPINFKDIFTLIDSALYASKNNGRNQLTIV